MCELERHALPEVFTLIFRNNTVCICWTSWWTKISPMITSARCFVRFVGMNFTLFETDTQNLSGFSTAGKGQSTLTNTCWNPTYYMPSLVVGLGDTVTDKGKFLSSRNLQFDGGWYNVLWETMWWGLFGMLFPPMAEDWTQSNTGNFLDDALLHLICKRQMGFQEANFILSQKARVYEVQRAWGNR